MTMATYVLVHGSFQGGWIWQPVANRLRAAGHQVYALSLDGCGERKGQMRPGITTETQADEVARNCVFPVGSFSCDFGLKALKCFSFLPPLVCPLVNLPSIKRADPTALSPIPPKT